MKYIRIIISFIYCLALAIIAPGELKRQNEEVNNELYGMDIKE